MEKGKLIEFRVQGERRIAVVDRPEGKKDWMVIDVEGQSYKIRPQRIEYEINGSSYTIGDIPQFLQEVELYLDLSSLEVAWELLVEGGQSVTPSEMAQLLFSEASPVHCYAAHSLLCDDKIYFKKKGNSYEPRTSGQVEEIKHQLEVERQRQQEKEVFYSNIEKALAKQKIYWTDSDRNRLELLERLVLQPEQTHRNAQDILDEIGQSPTPEGAFELLVELGWWSRNENLFLRRSSYPVQFSRKVLDVVQFYLKTPPPDQDSDRLDLTHLKVYTIDDESTEEIDDGLSVEFLDDDQIKLWIHIADPTRLVTPGDELDLEARKRSTTLYLPTGMISMFPIELATGPMSLRQGQICPALSFGVILDDKGAVLDYSIHASLIKPTYRLTYHDVDEMFHLAIKAEPEIPILANASKQRHQWRKSQGSITIKMPEAVIKVKSEDDIVIELIDSSRSRQLVAEMMILAGEVAGHYCQKHGLPVPFRGQPQPELPPEEELLLLPPGPVRACALRRCMPRSEIGTLPNRHASLGLDTYTQVTSPIRRYTDLLTHFQLKAHLRGDPFPFPLDVMQRIIYSVTLSAQEATSVERQTNRYWGLEFLRRNADQIWQGVVLRWLREDENLGILLLEELGLELPHRFERAVSLGDRLLVQVSRSDPHRDEIRFREILEH
ncbi:ribonuclease catalytic domain-containing protein [Cyanobacterium sp. uoEpiScrs1]|uniref:ribonuclease catalytic domain-containing protein n=1 Tax=Cyanobacterium sp. uoEpiScrs1 TaxID=2976343 RepID=UPI00226A18C2|nr:ribonuclease R family protein [Cyanobacterium sp. uoEpiScrs1]